MRKSFNRLLQLIAILVMILSSVAPAGWAKQREDESIIKEAVAWIEDGEVRLQIAFAKAPKESELTIVQGDWEQSRTYRKASRLSVALAPESHYSLEVAVRSISPRTEQVSRWEIQLPNSIETKDAGELRKADWDKKAAQKDSLLEMRKLEGSGKGRNPESEEGETEFSELERWEKEFYQKFAPGEKPKEADLRSSRVVFEMEPNDTAKKADWIFDKQDAFGKIGNSGDVDFWKIRATENGVMNVSLRDIPYKQDYHLYVFDANERELARSELSGEAEEIIEGVGIERREWYYVMVKGAGNSHDPHRSYRLRIDFQSVQGDVKPDEYEPNNTLDHAYDMEVEQTLKANLHSVQDEDFYRFSFKRTSTLFVRLQEIPTGMDIDIQLFDEKGKLLGRSEKPKNVDEEIVFNANPGTYVIKVMANRTSGFTANSYRLDVKIHTIPVILIPGIGGSRLEVEENGSISEAWLALGNVVVGIEDPDHRRNLSLMPVRDGGIEVKPRTNGIRIFPERADEGFRAIKYLSYSTLITDFPEKVEQYDSMIKELRKEGYLENRTMFAMPYDWRYSNSDNASLLKEKIDLALQRTGARQVHLVAHSMGGLLVRETLLSNIAYQSKVRQVIYIGTPFLGSPRAYQAIKHGYNFGVPMFHAGTGKVIAEYAPAVYELMPSKKYLQAAPLVKKSQKASYTYNDLLRDEDLKLTYTPLLNQASKLHDKWDNKVINVPQYSMIGQGQSTLMGYFFDKKTKEFVPFYDNNAGDGTVPYASANHSLKDIKKKFYVTGEHAKLPLLPQVIELVIELVKGNDEVKEGIRTSAAKQFDYLYYMIKSEDGSFPAVTLKRDGREMTLGPEPVQTDWWDDISIEYHDKIIVVHVKDQRTLSFELPAQPSQEPFSRIMVRQFSSEDSKRYEAGREFILSPDGLIEVE